MRLRPTTSVVVLPKKWQSRSSAVRRWSYWRLGWAMVLVAHVGSAASRQCSASTFLAALYCAIRGRVSFSCWCRRAAVRAAKRWCCASSNRGRSARLTDAEGRRLSAAGVESIDPGRGLRLLEHLINEDCTQVAVLPINWKKFIARIPVGSEPAWLSEIARDARNADSSVDTRPVLLEELTKATPAERLELAILRIRQQAARVLAIDESNPPDPRRSLNELGFDSLTGVEFANRVGRSVGQHLNPAILFDYPTLEGLAGYVVRDMLHLEMSAAHSGSDSPGAEASVAETSAVDEETRAQTAAQVESMSDKEMEEMVNRQLQSLQTSHYIEESVS